MLRHTTDLTTDAKTNARDAGPRGSAYGPYPRRGLTPAEQAELDRLLDDVRRHGYAGISPAQRSRLFELSSHIK